MIEIGKKIESLGRDHAVFARFLHTLSFLEYVGARKILKSQHENQVSMEILTHASEEMRHARIFKKLAEEVGGRRLKGYVPEDLLCKTEAKTYFKAIDSENYVLTTLLVEERALQLYPSLENFLASLGFPGRVAGILKEEEIHLHALAQKVNGLEPILARHREQEGVAFQIFLSAMMKDCGDRV